MLTTYLVSFLVMYLAMKINNPAIYGKYNIGYDVNNKSVKIIIRQYPVTRVVHV